MPKMISMREMEASLFNAKTAKSHYSHVIVLAGLIAKGKKKNTTSSIHCIVTTLQMAWGQS